MTLLLLAADASNAVEMQLIAALASGGGAMILIGIAAWQRALGNLAKADKAQGAALDEAVAAIGVKIDLAKDERHKLEVRVVQLEGDKRELVAKVAALEANTLTKEIFELRTTGQDRVLATQTHMLEKHDAKLSALVEDVIGHEEQLRKKSSANMPAAKSPIIPRTDSDPPRRRTDGAVELAPGPMRPKLKSQQFK